jgi:hypothetical protein
LWALGTRQLDLEAVRGIIITKNGDIFVIVSVLSPTSYHVTIYSGIHPPRSSPVPRAQ